MAAKGRNATSQLGLLVSIVLIICICDIVCVWRSIEIDLKLVSTDTTDDLQLKQQHLPQTFDSNIISLEEALELTGDEQLDTLNILKEAGVELTHDIIAKLPRKADIIAQYGADPIIHNLESCSVFRDTVSQEERFAAGERKCLPILEWRSSCTPDTFVCF